MSCAVCERKREISRRSSLKYRETHREKCLALQKVWREENRDYDRGRQRIFYRKNKARIRARQEIYRRAHPHLVAFQEARANAKRRMIVFQFTFEEWTDWWGDDFELRGRKGDDLCMGRFGDEGPYRIGNIYKCTQGENNEGPRPLPEPNF